ncbi:kinase-like protein [Lichtheimia corymbifera JMRC:FSU:9682]|uniref:dual-specificity kinase n=1 Tax=Lichtheimia corymbifera JMRC:FSU:9682 TaxID=1263082 RepID=A0A068RTB0_9FUNG|nr:kinase-like protein [Lichtheimia corymbifera JMRC:FSU:9682]
MNLLSFLPSCTPSASACKPFTSPCRSNSPIELRILHNPQSYYHSDLCKQVNKALSVTTLIIQTLSSDTHFTPDWISQHDTTSTDPVPNSSFSLSTSSSSSSTTDRWRQHSLPRSSVAERRQQAHAERARQLQEMERQITDAATWSKRRTDLLTTSSQQHNNNNNDALFVLGDDDDDSDTKSNTTISSPTTSRKIDLRDATLEDLEGLIAASAQRLANYRLQKTTEVAAAASATTTASSKRQSMESIDSDIRSPGTSSSKKSSVHSNSNNLRLSYLLGSSGSGGDNDDDDGNNNEEDKRMNSSFVDDHTVTMADFAPQPSTTTPSTKRTAMASASYNSIRNKFESAAATTSQERILQFDPLLSTKTNGATKGKQSATTNTNLTSSTQSNLRFIAEARDKERRHASRPRPGELNLNDIKRSSSTMVDSPLTPTRLPTPRSNHASTSTAFSPRLASPAQSHSRRIRTLSTLDKREKEMVAWLRSDSNEKGLVKPSVSLSVSTSSRMRKSLPATKKTMMMEDDRDDSGDGDVEDQPKRRPIRTRTISTTSIGSAGRLHRDLARKNMKLLADFDPLLVDDKKKKAMPQRRQQHLLDNDDDNDTWGEADEEEPTLKRRQQPRSRVISMTTLERSSLSTSTRKAIATSKTTQQKSSSNVMPQESQSMSVRPASGRKRGKTLPGDLASPPAMAPLALPPMRLEPYGGLSSDETTTATATTSSVKQQASSTRSAKTPTRIPLPVSRTSRQSLRAVDNYSEDELLHLSESEKDRIATKPKKVDTNGQVTTGGAKIGPTTTVYSGSMIVSNSSGTRLGRSSDKPAQSISIRTRSTKATPTTSSPRPNKMPSTTTSENGIMNNTTRQRKVSTLSTSASASHVSKTSSHGAHGLISPPESIKGNHHHPSTSHTTGYHTLPSRRKPTLHERLQGLVDDSTQHTDTAWNSLVEHEKKLNKKVPVLRGGSASTSTKDSVPDKTTSSRAAMSSQAALKLYHSCLSSYEKKEILDYSQVYFVGNHAQKRLATKEHTTCNHGYDDDRGDYHIVLRDHLAYRYEVLEVLGKGSFGQVLKCFDHKEGKMTAVKIIRNKKRFHAQALVEVKILKDLIEWARSGR